MAKKKINIKSVTADVPSGDVNITYKNVRIAGLSESTTAVLETEDTICEDDIEVEYTKPQNSPRTLEIKVGGESLPTPFIIQGYPGAPCDFKWAQIGVTYSQVNYVEELDPASTAIAACGSMSDAGMAFYMPIDIVRGFNVVLK